MNFSVFSHARGCSLHNSSLHLNSIPDETDAITNHHDRPIKSRAVSGAVVNRKREKKSSSSSSSSGETPDVYISVP